jgi:5-methylcytosine-specific restriction protein A
MSASFETIGLAEKLASIARKNLGVDVSGSVVEVLGGQFASIRFNDLPKPSGFALVLTNSASRVSIETVFDNFAKPLITSMSDHTADDYAVWASLASTAESQDVRVLAEINGVPLAWSERLPSETWETFHLEVSAKVTKSHTRFETASRISLLCISLLLALMSVEESETVDGYEEINVSGLGEVEGRKMRVEINRYERSRKNRAACISIYGDDCQVCKTNFGEKYGILGRGYIEVHHRTPVSLMGSEYALSPAADLIPVCSNCHRMMHKEWPPVAPERLREIVEEERNAQT